MGSSYGNGRIEKKRDFSRLFFFLIIKCHVKFSVDIGMSHVCRKSLLGIRTTNLHFIMHGSQSIELFLKDNLVHVGDISSFNYFH
jgi:hypothetical protein